MTQNNSTFQPHSNLLSSPAPERLARSRSVSWSDPVVVGSGPEPTIDIDGREAGSVTTLVLEIAFSATCVDGGHVIWKRFLSVNDWIGLCHQGQHLHFNARQGRSHRE